MNLYIYNYGKRYNVYTMYKTAYDWETCLPGYSRLNFLINFIINVELS